MIPIAIEYALGNALISIECHLLFFAYIIQLVRKVCGILLFFYLLGCDAVICFVPTIKSGDLYTYLFLYAF